MEKYDSRLGKASRSLITTQLDWMRALFELMGKGRSSGDLAFALVSRTQGSAVLEQVLRDPAVIQSAAEEIGAMDPARSVIAAGIEIRCAIKAAAKEEQTESARRSRVPRAPRLDHLTF